MPVPDMLVLPCCRAVKRLHLPLTWCFYQEGRRRTSVARRSKSIGRDSMKTLHIVSYEKFLSHIIEASEEANQGQNRYIVCGAKGNMAYTPPTGVLYRAVPHAFKLDAAARADIEWCDALFLHPLNRRTSVALTALRPQSVAVWCGMGGDYYKYWEKFRNHLYLPQTAKIMRELRARDGIAGQIENWLPTGMTSRLRLMNDPVCKIVDRVDFFCVHEKDVALEYLPRFQGEILDEFGYYTYEAALSMGAPPVEGTDILIGNSADPTNNHVDIFEHLRHVDLNGRRIVLPLSYGSTDYADAVARRARSIFGDEGVTVLRDWLSIVEYNHVLSRCGTVIMNHCRGQAMGNICSMIIRGAHVHLRPENPYSAFLRDLDVAFSHIGQSSLTASINAPLSKAQKASNARVLTEYWKKSSVQKRCTSLFKRIEKEVGLRTV